MTLDALTVTLDSLGVVLSIRLVVDAPNGTLTPEIKAALRAHKPALAARLASAHDPATPETTTPQSAASRSSRPDRTDRVTPELEPCVVSWRSVVGAWPIPLRQRWGDLANELAEAGTPWPEDEAEACRRVCKEVGIVPPSWDGLAG